MLITLSALALLFIIAAVLIPLFLRVVVATNEVHIVQSKNATISYGKGLTTGNTYYAWPSWIPILGVVRSSFPLSVFDIDLANYAAYDSGRVPFVVDVKAFFRITESGMAAERVSSFIELKEQLQSILQGSVRSILASNDIEEIMQGRGKFGDMFTAEVDGQLKEWGVKTVKNIEFMDIRDSVNSAVIQNIMEKKKSLIEKISRIEVASNLKEAEVAEIDAKRVTDVQREDAEQKVGERTAEKERAVGIAKEKAAQAIQEETKLTTEKEMAVKRVTEVKSAEIAKEVQVVEAQQQKETTVLIAEGELRKVTLEAEGIKTEGQAKADAEKAMQLAPVEAQIVLAKEIGGNQGYQTYLVSLESIKAGQIIGVAQAEALRAANIKVIANAGDVNTGVKNAMDIFSPKGGTALGGALEALAQTEMGAGLLKKFGIDPAAATGAMTGALAATAMNAASGGAPAAASADAEV
jgi:flotillin